MLWLPSCLTRPLCSPFSLRSPSPSLYGNITDETVKNTVSFSASMFNPHDQLTLIKHTNHFLLFEKKDRKSFRLMLGFSASEISAVFLSNSFPLACRSFIYTRLSCQTLLPSTCNTVIWLVGSGFEFLANSGWKSMLTRRHGGEKGHQRRPWLPCRKNTAEPKTPHHSTSYQYLYVLCFPLLYFSAFTKCASDWEEQAHLALTEV